MRGKGGAVMSELIGRRVRLIGDHPHAGETGTVDRVERTLAGPGLRVKLDNCPHGTEGCFVFKPEHVRYLKGVPADDR